jgi:hypothetical protein
VCRLLGCRSASNGVLIQLYLCSICLPVCRTVLGQWLGGLRPNRRVQAHWHSKRPMAHLRRQRELLCLCNVPGNPCRTSIVCTTASTSAPQYQRTVTITCISVPVSCCVFVYLCICACTSTRVSDEVVRNSSKFRAIGRVPTFCWKHPRNEASLTRCSQPYVGFLKTSRSPEDEELVKAIRGRYAAAGLNTAHHDPLA